MNDKNNLQIKPISKLDEMMTALKKYDPQVYRHWDSTYEYLSDDSAEINLKNDNGDVLAVDLENDFSMYFSFWSKRYNQDLLDYSAMCRDLKNILENKVYAINVLCNGKRVGHALSENSDSSPESVKKQLPRMSISKDDLRKYGAEFECAFWNSAKNVNYKFDGKEILQ